MRPLDRIIFGVIALSLATLALQPYFVSATGHKDHIQRVNIVAVGGYRIAGSALPTK